MTNKFDVIVIGGGPGGYVAAIRASQLGLKAAVIEKDNLGGICLNWGCIPTKALLRSAEVGHLINNAEEFGYKVKGVEFDIKKIVQRSRKVSEQLSGGVGHLMKKNKVEVIKGTATLAGNGKVNVGKETYSAEHIIIATGARARVIKGLEPDGETIWTYKEAMVPTAVPKSIVVVGSGAIGVEFASFYNAIGVDVTIIELQDRIVPVEDAEISAIAQKSFEAKGIKIKTGYNVKSIEKTKAGATVNIEALEGKDTNKTESIKAEKVIMAVGIVGNTENLGLENTRVVVEKGQIIADKYGCTDEKNVYAIGDVAGAPWLAHKASHEATICVEKLAGQKNVHAIDKSNIPGCTYSSPQIASVGLTEAAAKEQGFELKIGRFPFMANGKAIALGETEGLVKTIFNAKTGELLGAHMIGAEVTEMIQGFGIAKTLESTEEELMQTIFAHPTLSEMMHESTLNAYSKALHI